MEHIAENIRGSESVINIGAVGKNLNIEKRNNIKRHDAFKRVTKNIIGTDNRQDRVDFARQLGYEEIFLSDITSESDVNDILEKYGTFEHLILTEVIEHIGNLTMTLDNIYKLMNAKSRLYISTPNAACSFFHKRFRDIRAGTFKMKKTHDHICWFSEHTLTTLLERSNLVPVFIQEADQQTLFFIVKRDDISETN
jgi:2-polyprenyl-3-methyl-5-hydroxy-6-metoxy-1,4-benzoquinol methylase